MLYVYRPRNSASARDLAEGVTLLGLLARRTKGHALQTLRPADDQVICLGANFAAVPGTRVLNNSEPISKFSEAEKLAAARIPTVTVSRTRPAAVSLVAQQRRAFAMTGGQLTEAQIRALLPQITAYLAEPLPPAQAAETWLPRMNNHVGGNDLLDANLTGANYYSKKEDITEEYRIHMFRGKSIRAGKKFANATRPDGRTPAHQWIRSFEAGWVIRYDGFESTKAMRDLARKALKALGLDFGAVDIGKKANGQLIVLECNRAPGMEGGTIEAYARHIINWVRNPAQAEDAE